MNPDTFETSLTGSAPPPGLPGPIEALWFAAHGEWDRAHEIVKGDPSAAASHVHAWLHREEGDLPNADYWYDRAGVEPTRGDLRAEWREIVRGLLTG